MSQREISPVQPPLPTEGKEKTNNKVDKILRGVDRTKDTASNVLRTVRLKMVPPSLRDKFAFLIENKITTGFDAPFMRLRLRNARQHQIERRKRFPYLEMSEGKNEKGEVYLDERWTVEGFNMNQFISNMEGQAVEIGGPSSGFELLPSYTDLYRQGKLAVSNISSWGASNTLGSYTDRDNSVTLQHLDQHIDARNLPFQADSIPALISNGLPKFVYEQYILQAHRVLKENGILLMESLLDMGPKVIEMADKAGFRLVEYLKREYPTHYDPAERIQWYTIFQKVHEN